MSDTMAKSCRLFHTIVICNIKSPPCLKLEKIGVAQKMPGQPQMLEGSEIFRDGSSYYFLPFLKFSEKSITFSLGQTPHLRPLWGANLGQSIFFFRHIK